MTSNGHSESSALDLDRDLPTTADDVRALRNLRADVPSWLTLEPAALDQLLGTARLAVGLRRLASEDWPPFTLP